MSTYKDENPTLNNLNNDLETPTFSVLYNPKGGFWNPSEQAIARYNELKSESDAHFVPLFNLGYVRRDDPILLRVFEELGDAFDDQDERNPCKTVLAKVPEKYRKFCYIHEYYSGEEAVRIEMDKFDLCQFKEHIHQILNKDISDKEKLEELISLL